MSSRNRIVAGAVIAGTLLSAGASSAAPFGPASRPSVDKAPIEQVRMVCDRWGRCWNTHHGNGAAVGAAVGLGILGAAALGAAAANAAPPPPAYYRAPAYGYYAPAPRYCTAVDAYGRPVTVQC